MLPSFAGTDSLRVPGDVTEAPHAAAAAALACRYGSPARLVYYGGLPCCAEKRISSSNRRKGAMYGTARLTPQLAPRRSQAVPPRERRPRHYALLPSILYSTLVSVCLGKADRRAWLCFLRLTIE